MPPMPTNQEKEQLWQAYRDHKPTRVPVVYGVNPRVVALDPKWNRRGISFKEYFYDAAATIEIQRGFLDYQHEYLNNYCDRPTGKPKEWGFYADCQNVTDSAYFGGPLEFREGQVCDIHPYLAGEGKNHIFDIDINRPLDNPFMKDLFSRYEKLKAAVAKLPDDGIKYKVSPPLAGFDGPLTVATNLRGPELYTDFYEDPAYVRKLLDFIQAGAIIRNKATHEAFGRQYLTGDAWFADDSIQLISTPMYVEWILPLHRRFYDNWPKDSARFIHLCGDVQRHMPTIIKELGVRSWDTGFPVDLGRARQELGDEVEIHGGPEVALLLHGSAQRVYERTAQILQSGVMRGGRFTLREANNLPPGCPEENLSAMYRASLDHGQYAPATQA